MVSGGPQAEELKACCADAYSQDVVALLLGDSYHPGGLALTRRLADHLDLARDEVVLDVAAGRGTTALLLAREHDVRVAAVDLSSANIALGRGAADAAGLSERIEFAVADAERLPYPDERFDAAVCECAFCTFPDKPTAAAQFARVLRPGGRVGITDVTAAPDRLPPELTGLTAWIACVADARPLDEYAEILGETGLRIRRAERHDAAMTRMIDQIEARLTVLRMTARAKAEALGLDFDRAEPVLAAARSAVADGALGYALMVAEKPA
ncbi:MAG: methyltransferase domain-containing protein [Micromonosporaceae bacterium]|nr:methyltransferase domain-containing protein [Micromonosporaceae bacterium]